MLEITIPDSELYNPATNEFVTIKGHTLQLEHSLISISKWEARWEKPFLSKDSKTVEETVDYIRCMTLTPNVNPEIYRGLTNENIEAVKNYIDAKMTATWFNENQAEGASRRTSSEKVTSELIYYWMIANNIPFECQKWHLNRLLTLIRVCGVKNAPTKNMSKRQTAAQYASLNASRRKAMHSSG